MAARKEMSADTKTLDLIKEVNRQKQEISKAERPNWRTNMSFTYVEGKMNDAVNLHTTTNIRTLISIGAFLANQDASYKQTATRLGVESAPEFTWQGFSLNDWMEDLKLRITKIQMETKKKKLETLETRLNAIISPELRAQMELDAISAELNR